jgi:protein SCO1
MLLKLRAGIIVSCLLALAARPSIGDAIHAPATEDIRSLPLLDQHGKTTTLHAFEGRTLVVHFIFTHCVVACHTQVKSMKTVRAALTPETRARVQFLSVSLDPERDTPETLREYARTMGVDSDPDWRFATASPDRIARMTEFFAVKRERLADGQIEHTLAVFLLDPSGTLVQRYASPTDTERLTREISSVVRLYDPARQATSPTSQKR